LAKKARERTTKAPAPLPSREEVLAFIAEHPGEAGKREIARAFGIRGGDKIALKALLKDLESGGVVEKRRGRLTRPGDLPPVTVLEITARDRDGEFIAVPSEWPTEDGDPPRIVVAPGKGPGPAPGVGDRVLAKIAAGDDGYTARVIKILARKPSIVYGVVRHTPQGAQIEPVDRKQRVLVIAPDALKGAREGDLVSVRVVRSTGRGPDRAVIDEVIGSMKDEKAVSLIAILAHAIPHVFPPAVLKEAEAATPAPLRGREDWREDAAGHHRPGRRQGPRRRGPRRAGRRPRESRVASSSPSPSPMSPGTCAPARRSTARRCDRGNSVYFPDRVVPMLPERISNDLCSLRELEDRPACHRRAHGVRRRTGGSAAHRFHRIMMRSAAKLSYQQAQDAFEGRDIGRRRPPSATALEPCCGAAYRGGEAAAATGATARARHARAQDAAQADGTIDRIVVPERLDAHRLIEEFMIQANVAAAETLEEHRSHRSSIASTTRPRWRKLETLREFLKSIDMSAPKGRAMLRPSHFNRILDQVKDAEHGNVWCTRSCCAPRRRPNTTRRTSAISASICAAMPTSPRRSAAMPTSSSTAR
jgi:ribonuclease R